MVDSAPELGLTVPSAATPSLVTPVAGSYTGTPAGFAPKNQPAAMPARSRMPGRPEAVTDGEKSLHPGVGAVGDLRAVDRCRAAGR